jgi:peptide methionine sulfoxide reductase msrA/msrB
MTFGISLQAKEQTIAFSAGCFWGVEKHYEHIPGVLSATSGYAGGEYPDPTYQKILQHRMDNDGVKNYTETVQVVYDDNQVSTEKLIRDFWELHDPTQGNRQGNDRGNNYRSALFYTAPEQKAIAMKTRDTYQKLLTKAGYGKITTQIAPLKRFYPAEEYHQNYLEKHPNGYCPNHSTGVKFSPKSQTMHSDVIMPLGGKEIVVIDAEDCPFCARLKKDVTGGYHGDFPLRTVHKDQLKGYALKTPLDATPTILFIEDGKEVFAHRGYLAPKVFYQALGLFKLGAESEAYRVAFAQGTDGRFCKQYDKFKNTPDGVFVDRLSGDILFDTRDRFNSHSGWLSFYRAVPGTTIQREDNRFGMHRVEILAKKSGAHLGHVFNDAPGGHQRFCINATVLDFVPRDKVKEKK